MENRISILMFIPSLRVGGKERRLIELIRYLLEKNRYDITLVVMHHDIHYSYLLDYDISLLYLERTNYKKDLKIFIKFYYLCKKINPTIIHSWSAMTTLYAAPTKYLLNIPIIDNQISTSNPNLLKPNRIAPILFKINYYISDIMVSNSEAGLNAYNISDKKKTEVIYNGVHLDRFKDRPPQKNPISIKAGDRKYNIIMVASFMPHKNHRLLIDVAKVINSIRDDVSFTCVGDGPTLASFKEMVKNQKLCNVNILGSQQNVERIIGKSDIGVLFTDSEGISNVLIEYMAMAKPVITNDQIGGSAELIQPDVSGFITSDDVGSIVDKVQYLLKNEDIRIKMGNAGKNIVNEKFSISVMGKKYEKLYNKVFDRVKLNKN